MAIGSRRYFLLAVTVILWIPLEAQTSFSPADTSHQKDLIDIAKQLFHVHRGKAPNGGGKGIYFTILPGANPSGSGYNLLITSTTAAFYTSDTLHSFLSTVTFAPYLALHDRIGFTLRSNLWLGDNKWDVLGDTRFLHYPQYTWSLGGNPASNKSLLIDYKYIRFYQTFLRRLKPYFFAGLGFLLDDHLDMDTPGDSSALYTFTHYKYGTGGNEHSLSAGVTANLLYDSRKNSLNPLPGFYGNAVYRFNPIFSGSAAYWNSLYLDIRKYVPFSHQHQNMLAFWSFYWTVLGSKAPYLDLPSIGWDPYQQRSGRGFDQNRYRGNGLLDLEAEYRRDLTANGLLGFVLFGNINSVTEPVNNQFAYFHPAAGAGLRIKFNKHSQTNIAIDYGVSKGFSRIYLNLGETF